MLSWDRIQNSWSAAGQSLSYDAMVHTGPRPPGIPLKIKQLHMKEKNMCKALVLPEVFFKIVAK